MEPEIDRLQKFHSLSLVFQRYRIDTHNPAMYCFWRAIRIRMTGIVTNVAAALDAPIGGSRPAVTVGAQAANSANQHWMLITL
jgi:hypothetical protein